MVDTSNFCVGSHNLYLGRVKILNLYLPPVSCSVCSKSVPFFSNHPLDDWALALGADEEIVFRLHPEVPETGEVDDYLTEPC